MFTQIQQEAEQRELLRTRTKTEELCVCVCWRHDCHHQLQPGILYFEDRYDDIPALSCILTVKLANFVAEQIQPCSCRYCHQYFSPAVGNLTRKEIKEFSAGVSRTY